MIHLTGDAVSDAVIIIASQLLHFVAIPSVVISGTLGITGIRLFRTWRNGRNIELQRQHNLHQDEVIAEQGREISDLKRLITKLLPMWEKLGLTEEEWNQLPESERQALSSEEWTTVPCANCGKPVLVKQEGTPALCMSCDTDQNGVADSQEVPHVG